jgi:hypothetical protein
MTLPLKFVDTLEAARAQISAQIASATSPETQAFFERLLQDPLRQEQMIAEWKQELAIRQQVQACADARVCEEQKLRVLAK